MNHPQEESINLNNFHQFLPGSRRRQSQNPESIRIMSDLDKVLAELGLNGEEIFQQITRTNRQTIDAMKAGDYAASEQAETEHNAADQKLLPAYKRMIELGHDPQRLIT
jgi:hypothetical protein